MFHALSDGDWHTYDEVFNQVKGTIPAALALRSHEQHRAGPTNIPPSRLSMEMNAGLRMHKGQRRLFMMRVREMVVVAIIPAVEAEVREDGTKWLRLTPYGIECLTRLQRDESVSAT